MPRSQCESENVQFVQELAEVDGPFESPININFRDLTKLELPSLVWNRGDMCPKKMKITNTGHTVILSGKWKCERPYLTGGPLSGKYVFSQIHFHWGQDDCRGSEHQVCGDGFPLEMHVAHFKTEYLTQECALREKDGMVVLVYLFKLQDEPNQSLKKIISLLPCVKQPSTSHAIDPRPILSFCNPFTDDYFMYWGSVVTSTCAHILLWIICREPFGISRDQVNEFRKIMDSCQQPIFRNSRDIQPLHKRNVFHVNASKHLDNPLLPVKKLLGCYCKESGENVNNTTQPSQDCKCQAALQNQEECEGNTVEYTSGHHCLHAGGVQPMHLEIGVPTGCFHHNQTYFVQTATVQSVSLLVKRLGSEPVGSHSLPEKPRQSVDDRLLSQSCCFLPLNECSNKIKTEKRTPRGKRPFNSMTAFSQILRSLEVLKNHTFKKLKEIESINQEINGMKFYCHGNEDKRWLRRIEKMMKRQKRLTTKASHGCLTELKKLAKECNLDRIFECKTLPVNGNNGKLIWLYNNGVTKENDCRTNAYVKHEEIPAKKMSKTITSSTAIKFSAKAQKLIQSFFEDIQDSDELHENIKKDLSLKKMKSFCKQAGDSNSVSSVVKGFITPNMFLSGNLGNRFFTEVTTEDLENDESKSEIKEEEEEEENLRIPNNITKDEEIPGTYENKENETESETSMRETSCVQNESLNICYKDSVDAALPIIAEALAYDSFGNSTIEHKTVSNSEVSSNMNATVMNKEELKLISDGFLHDGGKKLSESSSQKLFVTTETNYYEEEWQTTTNGDLNVRRSTSNLSTDSAEIQRMIIAKIRRTQPRRDFWEQNSSDPGVKSYASPYDRSKEFESYYMHKQNQKTKKRKKQKREHLKRIGSREVSSLKIGKWKFLTKAKFKLEMEETSESFLDIELENSLISPKRKKLKLESQKGSPRTPRESNQKNSTDEGENDVMLIVKPRLEDREVSKVTEKYSPKDRTKWNDRERTLTDSSADSKTSYADRKDTDDESYQGSEDGNNSLNTEFSKHAESKSKVRSRSLAHISTESNNSTAAVQRLYLESLDNRRQNNKEVTDLGTQMSSPKKTEDRPQSKEDFSLGTFSELYDSDGEEKPQEISETSPNKLEYNVGFFMTASEQVNEKVKPKDEILKVKNPVLKRCDAEKYQFLEKKVFEIHPNFQDSKEDFPPETNLDGFTGDSEFQKIGNKELQNSVPYLRLKNSPSSRTHSAETLNSLKKNFKRKSKKRPHCCKRISRHYIRKNSSIIKKPHKMESKQLNFMSLTDKEQLKIISVNVANYLKEKLTEENKLLDPEKTPIDIEEAVLTKLDVQGNVEDKPMKVADAPKEEKKKQNKIPTIKPRNKKTEKLTQSESKTKIAPLKSSNEQKTEKPVCALPKPANNFIKLNKQMAGKYKKRTPSLEKKVEPKEKEKPCHERATKEPAKFRTKIPKKKIEKNVVPKAPEQAKARPETPSSSKSQKLSPTRKPTKESRIKSPVASKKTDLKSKKAMATSLPSNTAKESCELVALEQNQSESAVAACEEMENVPVAKQQHFLPAYTLTRYLPNPIEIVEGQPGKVNRYVLGMGNPNLDNYLPEVLYDNTSKMVTDGNELFKKELEYFITLEMLGISGNMDKSMNYLKSTVSQDYFGSNYLKRTPPNEPDSLNKEIVLLKMKDMECTSSASDFAEDTDKCIIGTDLLGIKNDSLNKIGDIITVKIPKESGEPGILSQSLICERPDETNSDSSYDCKISITLNSNFNTERTQKSGTENAEQSSEGECQMPRSDVCDSQTANYNRLALGDLDISNSAEKQQRRKRKENEISLDMKHKVLEILEGEIRREVGIKDEVSSENSSEGITIKWNDFERNEKSQSTMSNCDNIDVLTQISDTMRQYLQTLKENGQLVEIMNDSSDKESK